MKESRLFFCPGLGEAEKEPPFEIDLPDEEAGHAVRVLRMAAGDDVFLTNGRGTMANGVVAAARKQHCRVSVEHVWQPRPLWTGHIHVAVAPTKNADRMEWLVEKATEIGVDAFTFVLTKNSERRALRLDRLQRTALSAMKQSQKAWLPRLEGLMPFSDFLDQQADTPFKYIAHCYTPETFAATPQPSAKPLLLDVVPPMDTAVVLIGPEGDFSVEEVRQAMASGWQAVSLGPSRLRTETAALAAVHIMNLRKQMPPV